jgi:SnoaL-like polyketide cyclase
VTCGTFTATHLGEFQGLPPTGKQISLSIMHIDRVEDGKIVEHWGQGDALGLMQQLGIVFLPGPKLVPYILKGFASKLFGRA